MSIELVMLSNHLVLKRHQKQTNKTTRIPWAKSLLYFASSQSSSKPGYILSILLSVIIWNNLFKFLLLSLYPIPHFNFYTILSLSYRWIEWTPKLSCSKLLLISLPFFCLYHSFCLPPSTSVADFCLWTGQNPHVNTILWPRSEKFLPSAPCFRAGVLNPRATDQYWQWVSKQTWISHPLTPWSVIWSGKL